MISDKEAYALAEQYANEAPAVDDSGAGTFEGDGMFVVLDAKDARLLSSFAAAHKMTPSEAFHKGIRSLIASY